MDDTIENLGTAWVAYLNNKYGTDVVWEDIRDWDFHKSFPELNKNQVYSCLSEPELWDTVTPKEDAIVYLKRLMDEGHSVYIVTASMPKSAYHKTKRVLFKYFPYINPEQLIITANKQMIRGDVLVDDGVHNLLGGDYEKILMTAPHNIDFNEAAHNMYRANNWEEVYNIISMIDSGRRPIGVRCPRL